MKRMNERNKERERERERRRGNNDVDIGTTHMHQSEKSVNGDDTDLKIANRKATLNLFGPVSSGVTIRVRSVL